MTLIAGILVTICRKHILKMSCTIIIFFLNKNNTFVTFLNQLVKWAQFHTSSLDRFCNARSLLWNVTTFYPVRKQFETNLFTKSCRHLLNFTQSESNFKSTYLICRTLIKFEEKTVPGFPIEPLCLMKWIRKQSGRCISIING